MESVGLDDHSPELSGDDPTLIALLINENEASTTEKWPCRASRKSAICPEFPSAGSPCPGILSPPHSPEIFPSAEPEFCSRIRLDSLITPIYNITHPVDIYSRRSKNDRWIATKQAGTRCLTLRNRPDPDRNRKTNRGPHPTPGFRFPMLSIQPIG